MKKFFSALFCTLLVFMSAVFAVGCNTQSAEKVKIYLPDGAPALAVAQLMSESSEFSASAEFSVVDASVIQTYVAGESPAADMCILPVTAASKLLGNGENYKMLGTVTHGNLFLMKKSGGVDITSENIQSLKGKTVGVINLAAVPGLTFKIILEKYGLESFQPEGDERDENKVNLVAVNATEVLPSDKVCDYFVVPEPAATTKFKATNGALSFAGSLQNLYASENGYPQAVLVVKNSLIESNIGFVEKFMSALSENAEWLLNENTSAEEIVSAVESKLNGMTPTFTAANLSKEVILNCAVKFVKSSDCKEEVNGFLQKVIKINPSAASAVSDSFYYA